MFGLILLEYAVCHESLESFSSCLAERQKWLTNRPSTDTFKEIKQKISMLKMIFQIQDKRRWVGFSTDIQL